MVLDGKIPFPDNSHNLSWFSNGELEVCKIVLSLGSCMTLASPPKPLENNAQSVSVGALVLGKMTF